MAANPDTTKSIPLLMQKNVDNILQLYSKMKEEHEIHLNVRNEAQKIRDEANQEAHEIKETANQEAQRIKDEAKKEAENIIKKATKDAQVIIDDANKKLAIIEDEKVKWKNEQELIAKTFRYDSRIKLDIGGSLFTTTTSTVSRFPDSMLAAMFSGRHELPKTEDGTYFIDRYLLLSIRTIQHLTHSFIHYIEMVHIFDIFLIFCVIPPRLIQSTYLLRIMVN